MRILNKHKTNISQVSQFNQKPLTERQLTNRELKRDIWAQELQTRIKAKKLERQARALVPKLEAKACISKKFRVVKQVKHNSGLDKGLGTDKTLQELFA